MMRTHNNRVMKLGLVGAALLLSAVSARAARVIDRVVAVVNDDIILESELEQFAAPQYRGPDPASSEGKKAWNELKHKVLDTLIDGKLMQEQATELKLS